MGKKIGHVFKKVAKVAVKVGSLGTSELVKGALKGPDIPAPEQSQPAPATGAQVVSAPTQDNADTSTNDTEAARKAARSRGKRALSVARSSGTGLNI